MSQPFTYLIGWSVLDKYYYGVRYGKNCDPSEIWTKYFTSSKHVSDFRKENGEPDIVEIRRVFDSSHAARLWETGVLKRMSVVTKQRWLNKNDRMAPPIMQGELNPSKRLDVRKKQSVSNTLAWDNDLDRKRRLSDRMKDSNPMHDPAARKRISEKKKIWWTDDKKTCPISEIFE